jgi:hypothetical protein
MSHPYAASARASNVVRALAAEPARWRYGYDLVSEAHLTSSSLYPILIRLTESGLLDACWEPSVGGRPPRHMYRLARAAPDATAHVRLTRACALPRQCLRIPFGILAVAAIAFVWWVRAGRAEQDRRAQSARTTWLALPAVAAIVLLPWTVGIATRLPDATMAHHWNTAWAGLDVAIMSGLALTSWLGYRRDRLVALTGTATATLMCADAWFDLCTSAPGHSFTNAVAEAAAELVVAVVCLAIAVRGA